MRFYREGEETYTAVPHHYAANESKRFAFLPLPGRQIISSETMSPLGAETSAFRLKTLKSGDKEDFMIPRMSGKP